MMVLLTQQQAVRMNQPSLSEGPSHIPAPVESITPDERQWIDIAGTAFERSLLNPSSNVQGQAIFVSGKDRGI